jgi:hypothetical protein
MAEPISRDWTLRGGRWLALVGCRAAMLAVVLKANQAAAAVGDELIAAGSSRHVWLILEPTQPGKPFSLVHRSADSSAWQYRVQHMTSHPPAAMAAWGDRVWLLQPPTAGAGSATMPTTVPALANSTRDWQREVYSAQVLLNAATGLHYLQPAGRLDPAPPLPGLGRVAGFTATANGPVALIMPSQRAGVTISAGARSIASEPFLDRPMLLRLEPGGSSWAPIDLPSGFNAAGEAMMAATGPDGRELVVLSEAENVDQTNRFALRPDGEWVHSVIPIDVRRIRSLTNIAGQLVAVLKKPGDENELLYVRQTSTLPLTALPPLRGQWALLGVDNRLALIEQAANAGSAQLSVRSIDPITGRIGKAEPLVPKPLTAGRLWQMTLMIGLALAAVLLVVIFRPAPASTILIDAKFVLPMGWRMLGGAVDFVVGAIVAALVLDVSIREILTLPMMTLDVSRCAPYLLAAAIATAFAAVCESVTGRSVGKALVGGRLASLDGSPVPVWRVLARCIVRFVVLALPLLAVFTVTNSHMQGLPDWAGRTLVLQSDWQANKPSTENQ